jgi:hypothetical protein
VRKAQVNSAVERKALLKAYETELAFDRFMENSCGGSIVSDATSRNCQTRQLRDGFRGSDFLRKIRHQKIPPVAKDDNSDPERT